MGQSEEEIRMKNTFPTSEQLRDLADRLRAAYREACEKGDCDCITTEEHEKRLARKNKEEK